MAQINYIKLGSEIGIHSQTAGCLFWLKGMGVPVPAIPSFCPAFLSFAFCLSGQKDHHPTGYKP